MPTMLTTIEAVKEQLGIESSDTSMDSQIERTIKAVSDAIENYCMREFAEKQHVDRFKPRCNGILYVSQWPIVSIAEIKYAGQVLNPQEYEVFKDAINKIHGNWAAKTEVTYTAGYKLPGEPERNLPYDIEDAAVLYATTRIRAIANTGIKSEQVDVLRIQYDDPYSGMTAAPPAIMALINPYRRIGA